MLFSYNLIYKNNVKVLVDDRTCPTISSFIVFILLSIIISTTYHPLLSAVPGSALCSAQHTSNNNNNYIEYNLADYCTEERWSDYPGRHLIRLEKSLKIRLPSILDFQYNDTHGHRFGFYRPGLYALWQTEEERLAAASSNRPAFVPYCLLSFTVAPGHRIYAEGIANGLVTGAKEWFTETLHFKTGPIATTNNLQNSNQQQQSIGNGHSHLGTFNIATEKNSLTLVFEQLHLAPFSLHLILTPFHQARTDYAFGCDSQHDYQCMNGRCIAKYLSCDHHNNCGDYSDEALNCMARVPTVPPTPTDEIFGRDESGAGTGQHYPPTSSELPTFPIDPIDPSGGSSPYDPTKSNQPPEYYDVPFPDSDRGGTSVSGSGDISGGGHYYRPSTITPTLIKPKAPLNGFHGAGATGGGFLGDLFRFESEPSNVVKVVRYLLALLVIIIVVTVVNFIIWCLITKRDQSFMATAQPEPAPSTAGSEPPLTIIAV